MSKTNVVKINEKRQREINERSLLIGNFEQMVETLVAEFGAKDTQMMAQHVIQSMMTKIRKRVVGE